MKSITGTQVLYFKESITFESKCCTSKKVFVWFVSLKESINIT